MTLSVGNHVTKTDVEGKPIQSGEGNVEFEVVAVTYGADGNVHAELKPVR